MKTEAVYQSMNEKQSAQKFGYRREAFELSSGQAIYVDDLPIEGDWFGGTLRSVVAHGKLLGFEYDKTFDWSRVVVVTVEDIPGPNVVICHDRDQPSLCDGTIRHSQEPLALVAAPNVELLQAALGAIKPIVEPLKPVFEIEESLKAEVKIFGERNIFLEIPIERGDVELAMSKADVIVESTHQTPAQEHLYLETNGMRAKWNDDNHVTIEGSIQCPYYLVDGVSSLMELAPSQVRVIVQHTGGGFGGKEDFPTMLAGHAALLARKCRRPVRMVYNRMEDMRATTKRHPSITRRRTGLKKTGEILATQVELLLDGGAYSTLSPFVLSRAALHAIGPYRCDNVQINAKAVATNHPPNGGFRGFGCPQVHFANETHMDLCAEKLGMDPVKFRRMNLLRAGDLTPTGQVLDESTSVGEVFEKALELSQFVKRRNEIGEFNKSRSAVSGEARYKRRGIGMAVYMHGTGLNEYWETISRSCVRLETAAGGKVKVLTSQAEFGQGTLTTLALIASEALGLSPEEIIIHEPDTAEAPNSGPTVASRTNAIVGSLIIEAAQQLKDSVSKHVNGSNLHQGDCFRNQLLSISEGVIISAEAKYRLGESKSAESPWNPLDAYLSYTWACCVAEVEADTLTGEISVIGIQNVTDAGKVIHPVLASGQVKGGIGQGVGWALMEEVVWDEQGAMKNASVTDYAIPTSMDIPKIDVCMMEFPSPNTLHGAKGIGEHAHEGPAPAIANALGDAMKSRFHKIPVKPWDIIASLKEKRA